MRCMLEVFGGCEGEGEGYREMKEVGSIDLKRKVGFSVFKRGFYYEVGYEAEMVYGF